MAYVIRNDGDSNNSESALDTGELEVPDVGTFLFVELELPDVETLDVGGIEEADLNAFIDTNSLLDRRTPVVGYDLANAEHSECPIIVYYDVIPGNTDMGTVTLARLCQFSSRGDAPLSRSDNSCRDCENKPYEQSNFYFHIYFLNVEDQRENFVLALDYLAADTVGLQRRTRFIRSSSELSELKSAFYWLWAALLEILEATFRQHVA